MFRNILAALDGSKRSPEVLRRASLLAQGFSAKLHLCRAMAIPLDLPRVTWALKGDDLGTFLLEHGLKDLSLTMEQVAIEIRGEIYCRIGSPWRTICDIAGDISADLLVVGTHGYEGIDHLIGTTAAKVVNHATCSVLVVKEFTSHSMIEGKSRL